MNTTVIIPLFNKAAFIGRAVDSVLAQTYRAFELIVVDDGSTDAGPAAVARYSDPRLTLVRQANAGPGPARNRGLRLAQGEYVAFLDADDEWSPDYLRESVRALERYGTDVATISSALYARPSQVAAELAQWRKRGLQPGVHRTTDAMSPALFLAILAYMSPCSTVSRRDVLLRWGGFYEREKSLYGEDAHLWMKVLLNEPVAIDLVPRVRYHTEASGLAHNLDRPHPVEPFLAHPDEIEAACPAHLQPLLRDALALRALQTATEFGRHACWPQAQALLSAFCAGRSRLTRPYLKALFYTTPALLPVRNAWRTARAKPRIHA